MDRRHDEEENMIAFYEASMNGYKLIFIKEKIFN
jgi:hypothetical protein